MKRIIVFIFMSVLLAQISYAETVITDRNTISTNQWNVVIYPFLNKTEKSREETLKLVIQNSIRTFLSRVNYLNVSSESNETALIQDVFKQSYRKGYDIAVTGSYVLVGEKIYIFVSVYDVLLKQLKFENSYSGNAGSDIFDTLDEIIESLKQDVTKAVKPIDEETLIKYRKRIELVSGDIELDRTFVTTLGLNNSLNYKYSSIPFLSLEMRMANIMFGLNTFMPFFAGNNSSIDLNENAMVQWKNTLLIFYAGYRFFNKLTAGAGSMAFFMPVAEMLENKTNGINNTFLSPTYFGLMGFLKYDINAAFALKLSFTMNFANWEGYSMSGNQSITIPIPTFGLGVDYYFLDNWGLKLEYYYAKSVEDVVINQNSYTFGNTILLLGLNYRVDLK